MEEDYIQAERGTLSEVFHVPFVNQPIHYLSLKTTFKGKDKQCNIIVHLDMHNSYSGECFFKLIFCGILFISSIDALICICFIIKKVLY